MNELELIVTNQLEVYIGCESVDLGAVLIRDLRLADKIDKLRALIRVHAAKTGLTGSALAKAINFTLDDAKTCATQRNQIAHGIVRFDKVKKRFVSTLKSQEYVLRTKTLNELAETMLTVAVKLVLLCIRFTEALGAAYKQSRTSTYFANP